MKQGYEWQKFPFREECREDPSAMPYVLEEKTNYSGEFLCRIETVE
jgi:hypothetical protein